MAAGRGVGRGRGRVSGRIVRQGVEEALYGSSNWFKQTILTARQARKRMLEKQWDLDERAIALAETKLKVEGLCHQLEAERADAKEPEDPASHTTTWLLWAMLFWTSISFWWIKE